MININKRYMTTTAIGIIAISVLFYFDNFEIKPDRANLQIVAENISQPKIETEIKTTLPIEIVNTKIKEIKNEPKIRYDHNGKADYGEFYTKNLSKERIKNAEYIIRDDMYIPNYLEPIDLDKIYFPVFYGNIANQYSISFRKKFENGEDAKNYMENLLGYEIISYSMNTGNNGMLIEIQLTEKTAQEVENIKSTLQYLEQARKIKSYYMNMAILPEYSTGKIKEIIDEMEND